jgi:hypothetical protein
MEHQESQPGASPGPDTISQPPAGSAYQEEVAEFFRSLGLRATTNVTLTALHT